MRNTIIVSIIVLLFCSGCNKIDSRKVEINSFDIIKATNSDKEDEYFDVENKQVADIELVSDEENFTYLNEFDDEEILFGDTYMDISKNVVTLEELNMEFGQYISIARTNKVKLIFASDIKIKRHVLIKFEANPYLSEYDEYYSKRRVAC